MCGSLCFIIAFKFISILKFCEASLRSPTVCACHIAPDSPEHVISHQIRLSMLHRIRSAWAWHVAPDPPEHVISHRISLSMSARSAWACHIAPDPPEHVISHLGERKAIRSGRAWGSPSHVHTPTYTLGITANRRKAIPPFILPSCTTCSSSPLQNIRVKVQSKPRVGSRCSAESVWPPWGEEVSLL